MRKVTEPAWVQHTKLLKELHLIGLLFHAVDECSVQTLHRFSKETSETIRIGFIGLLPLPESLSPEVDDFLGTQKQKSVLPHK